MTLDVDPAEAPPTEAMPPAPSATGEMSPPTHLSPSGASTYEQCAKRWRWRYVDHLADPPGEAALVGSFAHRVLELLMQADPADRTKERARKIATQEWPEVEADDDFVALSLDTEGIGGFKWKAWRAIENLWKFEPPDTVEVRSTEQRVEADLGGVPFRGIVDRLDVESGRLVVTDYKSGNAPSERYESHRLPQVLLYAAAIGESTGEMPVRARLLFLGKKYKEVSADVTPERLGGVIEKLVQTWDSIRRSCADDDFPTKTGPLCGWCPYLHMCDSGQAEVSRRDGSVARPS